MTSLSTGELISKQQRLLTAPVAATVTDITLRPGTLVTAGSVILQLENPQLRQQVQVAARQCQQKQSEITAFIAQQQQELLLQQDQLSERSSALEQAKLELNVHMELQKKGVVSSIELRKSQLLCNQAAHSLLNAKDRLSQFIQMQQAQRAQKDMELSMLDSEYRLLLSQQEQLTVKAGIDGVIQQLDVEVGQSLQPGAPLARIGSHRELNAKLLIPERHVAEIEIGSSVVLDIGGLEVQGEITRIEAVVSEGLVVAETKIIQPLPQGWRPAQRIRGEVMLQHIDNATYVGANGKLSPNQNQYVYVKSSDKKLIRREVVLGETTGDFIIVKSGLSAGDEIVSSYPKEWLDFEEINLK
ncbi:hypothetical protein A5320_09015 [Rheinheimera sp. SA_1]|nr:hypothetical protein A5320_09015 [Rheinheimera sp. SA_1]